MIQSPEESTNRRNFSIASKFIDGVTSYDLRTMLATFYTISKDSAPTSEEMRQKSREYIKMKRKKHSLSVDRNLQGGANRRGRPDTSREMIWTISDRARFGGQRIIT